MALSELEERLLGVGKDLLTPPSDVGELLALLDQAESLLSKVEQLPKQPIAAALLPLMKALVARELMKHSNKDVKVAVASCMSEVTRITAPEPPYNDDQMKAIFEMIVDALEGLDELSSRSHAKRILILETLAKVRSCLVMLDLECDDLILHMFRHFFRVIRPTHPERVHKAMETIMTLVLEESEEISPDLAMCLLSSVKKDNKDFSPIAISLGKRVIRNCTAILKSCIVEVIRSTGLQLGSYNKIVASLCEDTLEFKNKKSDECLAEDYSLSETTVSEENKLCSGTLEDNTSYKNVELGKGNSRNQVLKSIKSNDKAHHVKASPVSNEIPDGNCRRRGRPPGSKVCIKKEIVDRSDAEAKKSSSCGKRTPESSDVLPLKKQKEFRQKQEKGLKNEKDLDGDSNTKNPLKKQKEFQQKQVKGLKNEKDLDGDSNTKKQSSSLKTDKGESGKAVSTKKHNPSEERVADLNENLIGSSIKVWWPMDKCFYSGMVDSFDPITKRHRVLYVDGEIENLQLEKEKWVYAHSDSSSFEEDRDLQDSISDKLISLKRHLLLVTSDGDRSHTGSPEKAKPSSTSLKKRFRTRREYISAFKPKGNVSASNKKRRSDGTKTKSEEQTGGNPLAVDCKHPDSIPQSCSGNSSLVNTSKMERKSYTVELDNKAMDIALSSSTIPEGKGAFDRVKD